MDRQIVNGTGLNTRRLTKDEMTVHYKGMTNLGKGDYILK